MHKRASGILLHVTSLPSPYGIGDLGPSAYQFVDFLAKAKQCYWQILPINPTDSINGHSPYSCSSAFAGNPLFISPEVLIREGWGSKPNAGGAPKFVNGGIDYSAVVAWKERIFKLAFDRFQKQAPGQEEFQVFCGQERHWIDDFALFVIAKRYFEGRPWGDWPKPMKMRHPRALRNFAAKFHGQILKIKFEQYLFFKQWRALKDYCAGQGAGIIGDIPIYVNYDSVDVWTHPKLFKLDKSLKPRFVSGVPPDYFSKTGQRWGNPVYDWGQLRKTGYEWWVKRIEHNLKLFDYLRIDHFRGFVGFWQIPAHEKIAVFGRWEKAPGTHFFRTLLKRLDSVPIIAEDLGYITPDVVRLVKRFKFPGMRVLLFAFDDYSRNNPHHPDNYPRHCVAYTGTHDNNTIRGWFEKDASWYARENVLHHLDGRAAAKDIPWELIKVVMNSAANTAIIPMQDVLGLGEEARINRPSTTYHNWQWRLKPEHCKESVVRKLVRITKASKRD